MSNVKEREIIKKVYPSARWAKKVDKMTDSQVVAVYFRFKRENKI